MEPDITPVFPLTNTISENDQKNLKKFVPEKFLVKTVINFSSNSFQKKIFKVATVYANNIPKKDYVNNSHLIKINFPSIIRESLRRNMKYNL